MIVGVTGQKRAGKDTVARRLVDCWAFKAVHLPGPLTEELCIIDPWCEIVDPDLRMRFPRFVRFSSLVAEVGIDAAKDISPDVRPYQQRYGTDVVRNRVNVDRWANLAAERIAELRAEGHDRFVLPNIRADNELALCDVLLRVVRPGHHLDVNADHAIEHRMEDFEPDHTFVNDDTLAVFRESVDGWAAGVFGERPPSPPPVYGWGVWGNAVGR